MTPKRIEPGPGQESVWDYPRPPRIETVPDRIRVIHAGQVVADTVRALRVLETASPPTYYVPPEDVQVLLERVPGRQTWCEWKGRASYYDVIVGTERILGAAWAYQEPTEPFRALKGYFAFYAGLVEACFVGDDRVQPQAGDFYGGWVTSKIVGPFKGERGTGWW